VIDKTFAFTEAAEALRYMESGRHFGKIVVRFLHQPEKSLPSFEIGKIDRRIP
jgi:hypothetical protein